MKIFLDTADIDEIRAAVNWGILDGVTTNPTLLSKEMNRTRKEAREIQLEICEMVEGVVNAEVTSLESSEMVREGRELAALHKKIVVKTHMGIEGLQATKTLSSEGIRTNMTLIFSANQALLAAKAGASYVSPFIGRLDDLGHLGMEVIRQIVEIFDNYEISTEVLVASIRHPLHVIDAALLGADIATMPFAVLEKMVKHPLTDIGLKRFLDDWKKAGSLEEKIPLLTK
ncbi:fructose-6-phosphate aldolase [candidate division TA06 bacterium]|nr:fructose-6-phosphate aldolase [candidate division TA06 bacterium]